MTTTKLLALLPAAPLLILGGCMAGPSSLDRLRAAPAEEYRGHYTTGSDGSWFRPCGAAAADSAWWVTAMDAAVAQLDGARRAGRLVEGRPSFVHWRAAVTRGGEVGPRGPGAPALLVREVLAVRSPTPGDCAAPEASRAPSASRVRPVAPRTAAPSPRVAHDVHRG